MIPLIRNSFNEHSYFEYPSSTFPLTLSVETWMNLPTWRAVFANAAVLVLSWPTNQPTVA